MVDVPVGEVDIAPENVRYEGDAEASPELMKNIGRMGLLQDIVGYRGDDGRVKVVIGRDRFHALKSLGRETVPVRIREELKGYDGRKASFSENIARSDMDPVSRAMAVRELVESSDKSLRAVGRDVGIPVSSMSEWMSILELDPQILEQVRKGSISFHSARKLVLAGIAPEKQQMVAAKVAVHGGDVVKELLREIGAETRGAPAGLLTIRFNFNPKEDIEQRYYDIFRSEAVRLGVEPGAVMKGIAIDWAKTKLKEDAKQARS